MIPTAVGILLILLGVFIFYAYRNPIMKQGKGGSFNPSGFNRLDVILVYLVAVLTIAAGTAMVLLL